MLRRLTSVIGCRLRGQISNEIRRLWKGHLLPILTTIPSVSVELQPTMSTFQATFFDRLGSCIAAKNTAEAKL